MTAQTATGHITQDADAVPAKPEHKISQLTTGELARERARLEAALRRPFAAEIKRLLRSRLDAVQDEQAQRARRRDEDVAAAKAELAAQDAARAAGG
jgi:hypothetical protein